MAHPLFHDDAVTERVHPAGPSGESFAFRLTVVESADGGRVGAILDVDGSTAPPVVGKSRGSSLVLEDAATSRRHASFDVAGRALRVTDLGSTNGTFVNGIRVTEAFLEGGELVRVGASVLRVERHSAAAPPTAGFGATSFGRIIGASAAMRRLYPLFERLAISDIPVLIEGESGSGKELLAETIHELGARRTAPFMVLDCSAIAGERIDDALFGARGVFEQAERGTLLLHEVAALPLEVQSKLQRVIERGELRRSGEAGELRVRVDVRVVATTRRDLERDVEAGRFREDLFFQLAVGRVDLPPLRQRTGDEKLLAAHFARRIGGPAADVPGDFFARFEGHAWPGNVRELQNAVARRLALSDADPTAGATSTAPGAAPDYAFRWVLEQDLPYVRARSLVSSEFERSYVRRVLDQHDGNVSRAAAASGLARRNFQIVRARHKT